VHRHVVVFRADPRLRVGIFRNPPVLPQGAGTVAEVVHRVVLESLPDLSPEVGTHEPLPLAMRHLVLPKIEPARQRHRVLALVVFAPGLGGRAAHGEAPGRDVHHPHPRRLVNDLLGPARLRVWLHLSVRRGAEARRHPRPRALRP